MSATGPRGPNPETIITKQIRAVLDMMHVPHFKHWAGPFSEDGITDLIGTLPPNGRALYIEVKTPTGKTTPAQTDFMAKMIAAGAIAFVARSSGETVKTLADWGFEPAVRIAKQFPGGIS